MEAESLDFLFKTWAWSFMLILARMIGFINTAPVVSSTHIPQLVKIALAFLLAVLNFSLIKSGALPPTEINYIFMIILNLVFGVLIGFIASLVISTIEVAGEVIDSQAGLNSAVIMGAGEQTTILKKSLKEIAILIFLYYGGLEFTLIAIKQSFELVPINSVNFSLVGLEMADIIKFTRDVIILGVTIASPVLAVIVFQDIVLGIMSRAAQQINPFQLSFALKPIVGVLILMFVLPLMVDNISRLAERGSNIFKLGKYEEKLSTNKNYELSSPVGF